MGLYASCNNVTDMAIHTKYNYEMNIQPCSVFVHTYFIEMCLFITKVAIKSTVITKLTVILFSSIISKWHHWLLGRFLGYNSIM